MPLPTLSPAAATSSMPAAPSSRPRSRTPKLARLLHIDYDLLAGRRRGLVERLNELYETAEAIGDAGLGRHFDELLERQRKLIGVYFDEYRTDLTARAPGDPETSRS